MSNQLPSVPGDVVDMISTPDYDPALNEAERVALAKYFNGMRDTPAQTAPLICKGEDCEVYRSCPLAQMKKRLPLHKPCPVERTLVEIWTRDLIRELDIGPDEHVDLSQVSELVRARLFNKRAQEVLANSKSVIMAFRGLTEDGQPILEPRLHPIMYAFDRNSKIIQENLEALVATRDAKSKDKSRQVATPAAIAAMLMNKVNSMAARTLPEVKDAEFSLKPVEDADEHK